MKKKNVVLVVALIVFFTNAPSLLSRSSASYFDSYLIRYGSKYHIPDLKMIRAQIQQESNFNFLLVNRENPCDSKIDGLY